MAVFCKVHSIPREVETRLAELDLQSSQLCDVLRHIALVMNTFGENHPSWGPGITTASEAVATLRSILQNDGWTREEEKGFALTVHPTGRLAVNIAKGDEDVGVEEGNPSTVSDKGVCTVQAIAKNQLSFPFGYSTKLREVGQRPTWYLLYCQKKDGLYGELSLPIGLSDKKQINKWIERIILPIMRQDHLGDLSAGFDDGGFGISVSKKKQNE